MKAGSFLAWRAQSTRMSPPFLIVESVGFGRDGGGFELSAGTRERDGYFGRVCVSIRNARPRVAGLSFWAWGGEGRPRKPKAAWAPGDAWTGHPPNVPKGMHSIL